MLLEPKITAFIPTKQVEKSKQFYSNVLGLNLVSEDAYGIEFESNGCFLRIAIVHELKPYPFTVLGFKICDIESHVKSLIVKGVKFEKYDGLAHDNLGIWTSPSKAKVAWFKDPDGNLLSLTESPL